MRVPKSMRPRLANLAKSFPFIEKTKIVTGEGENLSFIRVLGSIVGFAILCVAMYLCLQDAYYPFRLWILGKDVTMTVAGTFVFSGQEPVPGPINQQGQGALQYVQVYYTTVQFLETEKTVFLRDDVRDSFPPGKKVNVRTAPQCPLILVNPRAGLWETLAASGIEVFKVILLFALLILIGAVLRFIGIWKAIHHYLSLHGDTQSAHRTGFKRLSQLVKVLSTAIIPAMAVAAAVAILIVLIRFAFEAQMSRPKAGSFLLLTTVVGAYVPLPEWLIKAFSLMVRSRDGIIDLVRNSILIVLGAGLIFRLLYAACTITQSDRDLARTLWEFLSHICTL
jgi:hypothetical protein